MSSTDLRERRAGAYENPRPDVQALVPASARRILDVGCSSGALGAALKAARPGITVTGVEYDQDLAADAERRLDRVVVGDAMELAARDDLADTLGRFDCVICADVLEHLAEPEPVLAALARLLDGPEARIVVSLPNVRYWETFWQLGVRGRWPRRPVGLFDRTHLRWFTLGDAHHLLWEAGLDLEQVDRRLLRPDGRPWPAPVARTVARLPVVRTLMSLQFVLVARRERL